MLRKNFLKLTFTFLILVTSTHPLPAQTKSKIDLSTPDGQLMAMRKDTCSTVDGKTVIYTWHGEIYSRRRGEPDQKLFNVEGMNIRQCGTVKDKKRGTGFRTVSREIMLYLDPKTNEILDKWENPWLGREVNVIHVANDPVNFGQGFFARNKDGEPTIKWPDIVTEDSWYNQQTIPLFYHNVLQGDYQKYVGGAYHAAEMFTSFGSLDDLLNDNDSTKVRGGGWSRISDYLPWMEMQGREGVLYAHAMSWKVDKFEDLSVNLKNYINEREPTYKNPPPLDDQRPNQTSWTVFKNSLEGSKLPRGGH